MFFVNMYRIGIMRVSKLHKKLHITKRVNHEEVDISN